jgi:hypothetical protein
VTKKKCFITLKLGARLLLYHVWRPGTYFIKLFAAQLTFGRNKLDRFVTTKFFPRSIIHLSLTFGSKAGFDWKKHPLSHQGRWGQCLERDCLVAPDVSKKGQALWAKLLSPVTLTAPACYLTKKKTNMRSLAILSLNKQWLDQNLRTHKVNVWVTL